MQMSSFSNLRFFLFKCLILPFQMFDSSLSHVRFFLLKCSILPFQMFDSSFSNVWFCLCIMQILPFQMFDSSLSTVRFFLFKCSTDSNFQLHVWVMQSFRAFRQAGFFNFWIICPSWSCANIPALPPLLVEICILQCEHCTLKSLCLHLKFAICNCRLYMLGSLNCAFCSLKVAVVHFAFCT